MAGKESLVFDASDPEGSLLPEQVIVTAAQMQRIEEALFEAGMPVAALMEKVAGRVAAWVVAHYPRDRYPTVGFIVGPGHNGGDALVVARELHHRGYAVLIWCPFTRVKALTASHKSYLEFLGGRCTDLADNLHCCDLIVDGGFGIGLTRPLEGTFARGIETINGWGVPVVSIDLPSGLETDSGQVLGTALRARQTLCLGLWKLGLFQDVAQPWIGTPHLIPFDIPVSSLRAVLSEGSYPQRLSPRVALAHLPLERSALAHKYTAGHALLIAGSLKYAGAALLAARGAIASGVGMLTVVVPEALKLTVVSQVPEALVIGAPMTESGAIAALPPTLTWDQYDVVACGPGLTLDAGNLMSQVFACDRPLVLDADGLNWLSQQSPLVRLPQRSALTLLTPHPGEFRRLFPDLLAQAPSPSAAAQKAAQVAHCTLVWKGAVSAIAHRDGQLWFNADSTPALARGGSGDVLTGLIAGLAAQYLARPHAASSSPAQDLFSAALGAVWWHAQTARSLAAHRTVLGCAPTILAEHLLPTLAQWLGNPPAYNVGTDGTDVLGVAE